MANPIHTVDVLAPTVLAQQDRLVVAVRKSVANVIGSGAGAAVVTALTFPDALPASYCVQVTPNQDAVAFVTAKTSAGFSVTLLPRLAANTLAVGTFDVLVVA
jgi:hypothetical protein